MINKKGNIFINFCLISFSVLNFCLVIDAICNYKNRYNLFEISVVFSIFVYYVSVAIHELAHFFTFIYLKIPMRAICFFPFCFINNGYGWETRINFNYIGLGGATVPNQIEIKNENDFLKIKKAFAYSMLAAPIASIVVLIIGIILIIMSYIPYRNESLEILASIIIIINFFIVSGCFTKNQNVCGDFFVYKFALKDDDIVVQLMYNYGKISTNYNQIRNDNDYLRKKLIKCFEKKYSKDISDLDLISIATNFINEFIVDNKDVPYYVLTYINEVYDNIKQFNKMKNGEIFKKFIVRVAYLFEYTGKHESALKIYKDYIINFSNKTVDTYIKIQAQQVIEHKDNTAFLLNKKNIKPDSFYSFYRLFNGYFIDEIIINKRIVIHLKEINEGCNN